MITMLVKRRGAHDWRQIPRFHPATSRGHSPVAPIVALAVATTATLILWLLDRHVMALFVLGVAATMTTLSVLPRTAPFVRRSIALVQRAVGTALNYLLIPPFYVAFIVLPGWYQRARRQSRLDLRIDLSRATYWKLVDREPLKLAKKPFLKESKAATGAATPLWLRAFRLVGMVLVLIMIDQLIGRQLPVPRPVIDFWAASPANDQPWYPEYWREMANATHRINTYTPFRVWHERPVTGKYINVDENGLRRSYNPPDAKSNPKAVRVVFFGGSSMWGTGNSDDGTIPSAFSRLAEAQGLPVHVTNYGVRAYSSYQEFNYWQILQLQGVEADFVVFYDGYNDIPAMHESIAGAFPKGSLSPGHLYEDLVRTRVQEPDAMLPIIESHSAVKLLYERCLQPRPAFRWSSLNDFSPRWMKSHGLTEADFVERLRAVYVHMIRSVVAMSRDQSWTPVFFWQPTFETRVAHEHNQDYQNDPRFDGEVFQTITTLMLGRLPAETIDLTGALDDLPLSVFFDGVHVNNKGSAVIAQAMLDHLRSRLTDRAKLKAMASQTGSLP